MRIEVIEVYGGFQLTGVQQPGGGWLVEIVPGGGGKPLLTEAHADQHGAFAAARLMIDRGMVHPEKGWPRAYQLNAASRLCQRRS